jgi:hypothetical protein
MPQLTIEGQQRAIKRTRRRIVKALIDCAAIHITDAIPAGIRHKTKGMALLQLLELYGTHHVWLERAQRREDGERPQVGPEARRAIRAAVAEQHPQLRVAAEQKAFRLVARDLGLMP